MYAKVTSQPWQKGTVPCQTIPLVSQSIVQINFCRQPPQWLCRHNHYVLGTNGGGVL
jgi:hypothetical protein